MTPWVLALFLLLQTPEALSERALAAAQQGRIAEAEQLWTEALRLQPKLFSAQFNLGFTYFQRGDWDRAATHLGAAAQIQPRDFNARYLHGAVLSRMGKVDGAIREWRAALAVQPVHPKLPQMLAVEYSKGQYFQDAAKAAAEALRRTAAPDGNLFLIAVKSHQDAGDHAGALAIAERFLKAFPNAARAQFEYGYELYRAGRRTEALPYIERARSEADYEEPHFFLGELYLKEGRVADAMAPLRQAIAIRRDYIAAWCALARALLQQGKQDAALTELLEAVKINPRHPQPHLMLSQIYFRMGDEARAAQEKALSLQLRREDANALEAAPSRPFPPQ